jgi:hypothetical protein
LYSVSDFIIGIALLYLFYHQGLLNSRKERALLKDWTNDEDVKDLNQLANVPMSKINEKNQLGKF